MKYAKDNNGILKYPTEAEFPGIPNWWQHDYQLRKRCYLPLVGEAEPREGYTAEPSTWHTVGDGATAYIQIDSWRYIPIPEPEPVPEPVVRYSKYLLKNACEKRGLWEQLKTAIEAAGKWESFLLINDIASDNPELLEVMPTIKERFGAETVDAVLAESIAN